MGKHFLKKLNDKGASLIAVLVAISVVSIMGIIITQLTITNIQMKEVERQAKTNFYDAEHVMDELTSGLNALAANAMSKAYTEMLGQYRTVTADGSTAKQVFARMYLDNMIAQFKTDSESDAPISRNDASGKAIYTRGTYDIAKVKAALKRNSLYSTTEYTSDEKDAIVTIAEDEAKFNADYENQLFILENVCVSVRDTSGNMVTIKTDMVFHTPDINLDGSNLVKEFMRYSLIADKQIKIGAAGVKVDGNVYAGSDGIEAETNGEAKFVGKKVVTRGDIVVGSKGNLTLGNEADLTKTQVWAKNLKTIRTLPKSTNDSVNRTQRAKLNLAGYMFISDDLELNGLYDEVAVKGEYYGYNFQENYNEANSALKDAQYSSAIVINGVESKLNLEGVTRLMIAGRTFIGRNAGFKNDTGGRANASDIAMGESLAVRTNQIAYYLPVNCIDFDAGVVDDDLYEAYAGIRNVSSYLKSTEPYTEYNYKYLGSAPEKIYYLNFASDQKANDFYAKYYETRKTSLDLNAERYLEANALKLSGDVVLLLRGDLLYRNGSNGKLTEMGMNIDPGAWGYDKLYYKFSSNHALMYKALQLTLEDKITGMSNAEARLIETEDNKIFQSLVDEEALNALVTGPNATDTNKYEVTYTDPEGLIAGTKLIAIVKGDYEVPSTYTGGLVVATGNVVVKTGSGTSKFCGTIISKGTISFAANAEVAADEVLVSQMISGDIRNTIPKFATIFNGYSSSAEAAYGNATISKYLTYENWSKTSRD